MQIMSSRYSLEVQGRIFFVFTNIYFSSTRSDIGNPNIYKTFSLGVFPFLLKKKKAKQTPLREGYLILFLVYVDKKWTESRVRT